MKELQTKIIKIDKDDPEINKIEVAADTLKAGGTVAFPTETVYGLGANALSEGAIDKIFRAKGRPQDNPLIVHISDIDQIYPLVQSIPKRATELMEKFWPGPLTIIFNKSEKIPKSITGGLSTVAIRMPNHKIALELIRQANLPIAAPSANTSGKPSPTDAAHVIEDLMAKVDIIIDGGPVGIGLESTVLDISTEVPTILRPGGITKEDLLTVFSDVKLDPALIDSDNKLVPKSPGQKYRHYSPKAKVKIIQGHTDKISIKILELYNEYTEDKIRVGIMATEQTKDRYKDKEVLIVGDRERPETIASNLFRTLREFDKIGVDIILVEGINEDGIGSAIMNRMRKAAGGDISTIGGC